MADGSNKKQKLLLWLGVGGVVLGPAIAFAQKQAAEAVAFRANLDGAAMGYMWDIQPNYTGMWVGIIIAALGVIGIFMHLQATRQVSTNADVKDSSAS